MGSGASKGARDLKHNADPNLAHVQKEDEDMLELEHKMVRVREWAMLASASAPPLQEIDEAAERMGLDEASRLPTPEKSPDEEHARGDGDSLAGSVDDDAALEENILRLEKRHEAAGESCARMLRSKERNEAAGARGSMVRALLPSSFHARSFDISRPKSLLLPPSPGPNPNPSKDDIVFNQFGYHRAGAQWQSAPVSSPVWANASQGGGTWADALQDSRVEIKDSAQLSLSPPPTSRSQTRYTAPTYRSPPSQHSQTERRYDSMVSTASINSSRKLSMESSSRPVSAQMSNFSVHLSGSSREGAPSRRLRGSQSPENQDSFPRTSSSGSQSRHSVDHSRASKDPSPRNQAQQPKRSKNFISFLFESLFSGPKNRVEKSQRLKKPADKQKILMI
jgi:hypothetical protein